jgi:glycosyltransferase involved in cell wall biosynthesis
MAMKSGPMISVIVCTYNRPRTLQRALDSVFRQDRTDFEVIIVDDGGDPPVELPGQFHDRVRLIRTDHRGVGAARAEGLDAARADLIAYCDDDDEWKTDHLSRLVKHLEENPHVDLVFADSEWVQDGSPASSAWSNDYDLPLLFQVNYIFASDVVHRAEPARRAGGFDRTLTAYEDWDLWLRMSRRSTFQHHRAILGTRHWHQDCVSASPHWDDWERVYQNPLHGRFGEFAAPRLVPFDPRTWQSGRRELIWHSILGSRHPGGEGYATVGRRLFRALERQGVDITMALGRNQQEEGFEGNYKEMTNWGRFAFYCDPGLEPSQLRCDRVVCYWMWESTSIPPHHVAEMNRAVTFQYVPCRQNLEAFRECGVRVPMKVLHLGVDPQEYPYLSRPRSDRYTFGCFGAFSPRKGIDVLIRAFQDEFRPGEPVRLLLKSTGPAPAYAIQDPRITLRSGYLSGDALLEFLRQMDAFVLPSRGEGFGLCGLEAMATGLPLIATNWSGPAEYIDSTCGYPLNYKLVDAGGIESNHVVYHGRWAEPDYGHLRSLLRWLYEHPDEAAEKGRRAAERVHRHWTWDRVARQMVDDLDAIAGP